MRMWGITGWRGHCKEKGMNLPRSKPLKNLPRDSEREDFHLPAALNSPGQVLFTQVLQQEDLTLGKALRSLKEDAQPLTFKQTRVKYMRVPDKMKMRCTAERKRLQVHSAEAQQGELKDHFIQELLPANSGGPAYTHFFWSPLLLHFLCRLPEPREVLG